MLPKSEKKNFTLLSPAIKSQQTKSRVVTVVLEDPQQLENIDSRDANDESLEMYCDSQRHKEEMHKESESRSQSSRKMCDWKKAVDSQMARNLTRPENDIKGYMQTCILYFTFGIHLDHVFSL